MSFEFSDLTLPIVACDLFDLFLIKLTDRRDQFWHDRNLSKPGRDLLVHYLTGEMKLLAIPFTIGDII